uniref:B30.2/SPRY domain-containing protein n=1 Tax=Trichuris muris TaxID=70415 RepID=A0A5S6QE86_TRIMR
MRNPERSSYQSAACDAGGNGGETVAQSTRGRAGKRKGDQQGNAMSRKSKAQVVSKQSAAIEYPFNKDGYRYFLAECDPNAPNRHLLDESVEHAGKPIPSESYRIVRPSSMTMSVNDRAPQIKLSNEGLTATGDKGYCVVRGTHDVVRGTWFYEVKIDSQPKGSHARIGWSQSLGVLQGPVGYDVFSYSMRSLHGTRFHKSVGKHYGLPYSQGDILGLLIHLPESNRATVHLPSTGKNLPLIKFKSCCYFEEKDEPARVQKSQKPLKGSKIIFYINGVSQGVAFSDIYDARYFPAISLYKNMSVTVNFGPTFVYPPKGIPFYPMCNRVEATNIEQCLSDILYFVCNQDSSSKSLSIMP